MPTFGPSRGELVDSTGAQRPRQQRHVTGPQPVDNAPDAANQATNSTMSPPFDTATDTPPATPCHRPPMTPTTPPSTATSPPTATRPNNDDNPCHVTAENTSRRQREESGGGNRQRREGRGRGRRRMGRETMTTCSSSSFPEVLGRIRDDYNTVVVPASFRQRRGGGGSIGASSFHPSSCSFLRHRKRGSVKSTAALF